MCLISETMCALDLIVTIDKIVIGKKGVEKSRERRLVQAGLGLVPMEANKIWCPAPASRVCLTVFISWFPFISQSLTKKTTVNI
jgi:hypothetical protein